MKKITTLAVIILVVICFFACSKKRNLPPTGPIVNSTSTFTLTSTSTYTATSVNTGTATYIATSANTATATWTLTPGIDSSTYGFEDGTVMNWAHMYLDVTQLANSSEQYNCGSRSLKILCNFTSTAGGEAGINFASPVDLDSKTVTAYVYAPSNMPSGAKGYLCIKSTGSWIFERGAYVNFTAGAWNKLTFDTSHVDYAQNGFDHTDVRQLAVKIESNAASWQGAFYIDCVNIAQGVPVGSPTATRTPLPTQTPTLTPTGSPTAVTPDNSVFGFEDSTVMGWTHYEDQFTTSSNSTVRAYKGTHSLALPADFTGATGGLVGINLASPADLTGKIVTGAVWVPSDIPQGTGAFIYAKTGVGYTWVSGMWNNLTPGTWNQLYLDFNNYSYASGTVLPGDVRELGIKIVPSNLSGSYSSICYVDSIDYNDAPATATLTQTPSMTPIGATYTPTATATGIVNAPTDSRIQYFGRWDKSDPMNYRSDFGPVYIKINFTGTSCRIKLYDQSYNNSYQYSIDGGAYTMLLGNTSTAYTLASGLADTSHTLTFMRRTDATFGVTNFMGFEAAPGGTFTLAAPSARPSRRIEFIGDSITCGSGNEGTGGNSRTTENGYLAFGPQTAVALNAEWSLMSRGGLGAFRNWNEAKPPSEKHAIDYYVQTLYNYASPLYDFNTWTPDAVVVALGVNDFGDSPVRATPAEFEGAYSMLISLIRSKYPNAHIFCMKAVPEWSANQTAMDASVTNVVNAKTTGGDTKIHVLNINDAGTLLPTTDPYQYYIGDYTHPNVAGHALIAAKIAPQIQSVMGW